MVGWLVGLSVAPLVDYFSWWLSSHTVDCHRIHSQQRWCGCIVAKCSTCAHANDAIPVGRAAASATVEIYAVVGTGPEATLGFSLRGL